MASDKCSWERGNNKEEAYSRKVMMRAWLVSVINEVYQLFRESD